MEILTLGGSNVSAFAGLNGGTGDALGLQLSGVELGVALYTDKADATRSWTSVQASASGVAFVGVEGLTLSADTLSVSINQAGKAGDAVVIPAGTGHQFTKIDDHITYLMIRVDPDKVTPHKTEADSKADLLLYGNAERAIVELTHRLAKGEAINDIRDLRGSLVA